MGALLATLANTQTLDGQSRCFGGAPQERAAAGGEDRDHTGDNQGEVKLAHRHFQFPFWDNPERREASQPLATPMGCGLRLILSHVR